MKWLILLLSVGYPSLALGQSGTVTIFHPTGEVEVIRPAVPRVTVVVPRASRRGHWTHPGNIRDHLVRTHGYSYSYLSGLSQEQLLSIHDADHEGRAPAKVRVSVVTPLVSSYAVRRSVSACPGGVCPTYNDGVTGGQRRAAKRVVRKGGTVIYQN